MTKKILLILASLSVLACAKNRDVERVRAGDREYRFQKSDFLSPERNGSAGIWLAKMTVVSTSDAPAGTAFIGFQGDVKAGYFEFTNQRMQFRSAQGLFNGVETENIKNNVLMNWDITHHDYTLDERDGQTINQEIEDNFKGWEQKKYFGIAQASGNNEVALMPSTAFSAFSCWSKVNGRIDMDSIKTEPEHIGMNLEVVYQRNPACASAVQWGDSDFNFTVTYKVSFKRLRPTDYKPKYYKNEQEAARYKYGHFQTIRRVINPKDGRPHNLFMENRWSEKTHYFYYVKGFPTKYRWIWDHNNPHSVLSQTNKLMESLGSKLRFEIYDHNYNHETKNLDGPEREFGDLRYSFVNFIDQLEAGGTPLGYGPSDTNPFTGEIIAANTMVWTGMLDFYLKLIETAGESAEEESSLFKQMNVPLNDVEDATELVGDWDQNNKKGVGELFRQMAMKSRFALPFWNSFTSGDSGSLLLNGMVEKYQKSHGVTDSVNQKPVLSFDLMTLPASKTKFDYVTRKLEGRQPEAKIVNLHNVFDMSWLDRIANSPGVSVPNQTQIKNIHSVLQNLRSATDRNYKGVDGIEHIAKEAFEHHQHNVEMNRNGHCIIDMDEYGSGLAGFLKAKKLDIKDPKIKADIINTVLYRVSIHEFGHNLNLRHNFYGSVDKKNFGQDSAESIANFKGANGLVPMKVAKVDGVEQIVTTSIENSPFGKMREQVSSSVMDYVRLEDEINTPWAWEDYDVAALRDSYEPGGFDDEGRLYMFCTDEHTAINALCNRHDLGTTPSQILMSQIRSYDERYELRNKRFGRAYWNTSGYASGAFTTMWSMKEFLGLWRTAFTEDLLLEKMGEMGISNPNDQKGLLEELNREMRNVMKLSMAFYFAVIQQSRGTRDYRSEYDEDTGALKYIGIMADKIYAMMFLAGDDTFIYNPNRYMNHMSYLTYSEQTGDLAEFTDQFWRNIVTDRNVAMEPWFVNFARLLYAKNATNFNNRGNSSLINSIKIVRVEDAQVLERQYGVTMESGLPAKRLKLPKGSTTFKKGDDVVVVHVDGSYYMTSVSEGDVTFTLFQEALDKLTGSGDDDSTITQFNMDVREFYWLYETAKSGALQ